MSKRDTPFIAAILVVAVLVSGAAVFLGFQMRRSTPDTGFQEKVEKAIDVYIAKKQTEAVKAQAEANKPKTVAGDFTGGGPILGDRNAPVTIVEFSDFQCPYCGSFFSNALPQINEQYIKTGKARLIYRHFPLSFHPNARPAALAANCVRDQRGDEVFYQYHDLIFKNQTALSEASLKEWAKGLGINMSQFDQCVASQKTADAVAKDLADGQKAGVSGTPAFIINGLLISGAQPFEAFKPVIDQALAK
ncbi:DsbA family protein [Candidatus Peregrinibacteria bacterium]|nr:DsbA family protein [Candidatus Peregrinibacteria bacterium]